VPFGQLDHVDRVRRTEMASLWTRLIRRAKQVRQNELGAHGCIQRPRISLARADSVDEVARGKSRSWASSEIQS